MKNGVAAVTCALFLALTAAGQASPAQDVLKAMGQCAAVADEHERLACYDRLAPQAAQVLAQMPPAPHPGPPTAEEQKDWFGFDLGNLFGSSPAQQTTPQQFGSEALPPKPPAPGEPPPPPPLESISAKVTEFAYTPFGQFIVFLDNGQVWRQIEGDTDHANFNRKGSTVTISRGWLGSYGLTIEGSDKVFKVKRVK